MNSLPSNCAVFCYEDCRHLASSQGIHPRRVYQGVDLQGTHDQRTWFANRGFCPHPRLSFRTYVLSNAVRRGITMHTPLSSCPVCSSCTRAAARTGREVLGLFAAALRTVPTHDEAGPLCRKLAEWIEGTIDTRHHADMCAIK